MKSRYAVFDCNKCGKGVGHNVVIAENQNEFDRLSKAVCFRQAGLTSTNSPEIIGPNLFKDSYAAQGTQKKSRFNQISEPWETSSLSRFSVGENSGPIRFHIPTDTSARTWT